MDAGKTMARVAGALFLVAMMAYGTGDALVAPLLPAPDSAADAVAPAVQAWYGLLLMVLNSITVVAIALLLYPSVRRHDRTVARAYLAARVLEGLLLFGGVLAMAFLLSGSGPHTPQAVAQARSMAGICFQLGMLVLGVGSVCLFLLLLRVRAMPGWLGWWGLAGYALLAAGALSALIGHDVSLALSVPGGLFELVLGVWLMARGLGAPPAHAAP